MRWQKMNSGSNPNGCSSSRLLFSFSCLPRFKLHLRNKQGAGIYGGKDIPPLPLNKSVVDVFADFLRYLFSCAESYMKDTHANGPTFWESVKGDIDFVLSHPNGWEGTQQDMRRAAVAARLVPDSPAGLARLFFVTEGEASLHFSIQNGLPIGAMKVCSPGIF